MDDLHDIHAIRPDLLPGPIAVVPVVQVAESDRMVTSGKVQRALLRADRQEFTSVVNSQFAAPEVDDYQDMPEVTPPSPLSREDLLHLIELLDLIEVDTKWSACAQVLHARLRGSSRGL